MYDKELVLEILAQIFQATQTVLKRFEPIKSADDFTSSDSGMEKLMTFPQLRGKCLCPSIHFSHFRELSID